MKISALKKKLMPTVVASALASGMLVGNVAQAVHVAENGLGQFLIAPIYLAGYADLGHETDIIVTNTRTDTAVKAKLVIRSASSSTEIFDAILYLTPGDVWRGTVYRGVDGLVRLRSTDDSIKSPVLPEEEEMYTTICSAGCDVYSPEPARATFASAKPLDVPLFTSRIASQISPSEGGTSANPTDTMTMGHIEIIGVYAVKTSSDKGSTAGLNQPVQVPNAPNSIPATSFIDVYRTMSKFSLAKIFDTKRPELTNLNGVEIPAVTRDPVTKVLLTESMQPYSSVEFNNIRSTDPSWVQLDGAIEVRLPHADRMGYQMYALAGEVWDNVPDGDKFGILSNGVRGYNNSVPTFGPNYFDGRVVANPFYEAEGGQFAPESAIGFSFGLQYNVGFDAFDVIDNLVEIEHALSTQKLKGSYETGDGNNTNLVVTFPTRYRHHDADPCRAGMDPGDRFSRPFIGDGSVRLHSPNFLSYDNSENLPTTPVSIRESNLFSGGLRCNDGSMADALGVCPTVIVTTDYLSFKEVNYFVPRWNYNSGWFEMIFTPDVSYRSGCSYTGVPVVGLSHKFYSPLSGSLMTKLSHAPELQNRDFPLFPAAISSEAK